MDGVWDMGAESISIIITCRHDADALNSTLIALGDLAASGMPEVIVVDDGREPSREKPVVGAANRGLNVRYLWLPDVGTPKTMNIALRESTGELVAFMDDDCIPGPDWLPSMLGSFERWLTGVAGGPILTAPGADAVQRGIAYVDTEPASMLRFRHRRPTAGYYPLPGNMMARRESLILSGGFDESDPRASEVSMVQRMEHIGYGARYEPRAVAYRCRERGLLGYMHSVFSRTRRQSRGPFAPAANKVYCALWLLAAIGLAIGLVPIARAASAAMSVLRVALLGYALLLVAAGIHAAARMRDPLAIAVVPPMLLARNAVQLCAYVVGRFSRKG